MNIEHAAIYSIETIKRGKMHLRPVSSFIKKVSKKFVLFPVKMDIPKYPKRLSSTPPSGEQPVGSVVESIDIPEDEKPNLDEDPEIFRNLGNAKRFAIDIGGSLTKVAYYSTVSHRKVRYGSPGRIGDEGSKEEFKYEVWQGARLHFIKFETKFIEECLQFISNHLVGNLQIIQGKSIKVTGNA